MSIERRHQSFMTGQEIADTFGNREVLALEERHAAIESQLRAIQEKLVVSIDVEEQEQLQEQASVLREESRQILTAMRAAQNKFSASTGFKRPANNL